MSDKYPVSPGGGDMLLRKGIEAATEKPIDCMRLMLQKTRACPHGKIGQPEDAVKLMKEMGNYERERGVILHLDTKNNVVGVEEISVGSLNQSIVHPREAIKSAVLNNSAHVIFLHNHPSGDPAPSVEDINIDKKLRGAFDAVGIDLLDSIIIGHETYYSFKEHGYDFPESKYKEGVKVMEHKKECKESEIESEEDACGVAMSAALSVIKERCGEPDEEELETLERQASRMIEKANVEDSSRPGLERQVQYYKDNNDASGMLKLIDYLQSMVE